MTALEEKGADNGKMDENVSINSNYIKLKKEDFDIKREKNSEYDNIIWCELKIKGHVDEINKCKEYLLKNNLVIQDEKIKKQNKIKEITVCAGDKTVEIINSFPLLKMACFYEGWSNKYRCQVIVVYSESGFNDITNSEFCGYFDGCADGGDGRWNWEYDVTDNINIQYEDIATGEKVQVNYKFPYREAWRKDDYVLEIDGEYYYLKNDVIQEEFKIKNGVLVKYCGYGGNVIIPDSVTEFDWEKNVFKGNHKITSVKIPSSLTEIPFYAFAKCSMLKEVKIEEGVETIGTSAFKDCSKLEKIYLPETLKEIKMGAFENCGNLDVSKIQFPNNIEVIETDAFKGCPKLPKEIISNNMLLLYDDKEQKEYIMSEHISEISSYAFSNCKNIEKIYTSKCLKKIAKVAFNHSNVREIKLQEGIEIIESEAFNNCIKLNEIIIPESIKILGEYVFGGCQNLMKVVLPNSLDTLPNNLFSGRWNWNPCIRLKEVVLPEKLKNIGNYTFFGCNMLQNITIPSTVKKIGSHAFKDCFMLKEIILPHGLKSIGVSAFRNCKSLEEIVIPGTLKKIPNNLFAGCEKLKKVVIEEGVSTIGSKAFSNCPNLEAVYIYGELLEKQGEKIFYESSNVKIYGIHGTQSEELAKNNQLHFFEINN